MKCENCGNEHDGSYGSGRFCSEHCHRAHCGKNSPGGKIGRKYSCEKLRSPHGTWTCQHCGEILGTRRELQKHVHEVHVGNRIGVWNKGLTKETSALVRRNGEAVSRAMKKLFEEGKIDAHKMWTPERRKEQSERKKQLYKEYPEKHPNRKLAHNRNRMTYPERVAYDWLTRNGVEFKHQFNFVSDKFNRYVDFFCEAKNIFIEIDGEYWHKNKELDKQKDDDALKHGIKTIRISPKERIEDRLASIFNL